MAPRIVRLDRAQVLDYAEQIISVAADFGLDDDVIAAFPATWRQGVRFAGDPATRAIGYSLMLTALASTPGAPDGLLEALIYALRGLDPENAAMLRAA